MTRHDNAQGRYLYLTVLTVLTVAGVEYRVYCEETGRGIPVLLQHTAGVDGRQWRHLLEDEEITANFRLSLPTTCLIMASRRLPCRRSVGRRTIA